MARFVSRVIRVSNDRKLREGALTVSTATRRTRCPSFSSKSFWTVEEDETSSRCRVSCILGRISCYRTSFRYCIFHAVFATFSIVLHFATKRTLALLHRHFVTVRKNVILADNNFYQVSRIPFSVALLDSIPRRKMARNENEGGR